MKLTSLFSSRPRRARQRTPERLVSAPKPARKRSLNEAAHKIAR